MEYIGIDVHKNQSSICILTTSGECVEHRIRTARARFHGILGTRPRARVLIEASTESEWVARCVEALGHEVIVADPNYGPMYAQRSRHIKTDRRDARTLAEACQLRAYRPAHRPSAAQRRVRAQLAVREALVRTRSRYISLIRALLRRDGLQVRSGTSAHFGTRLADVAIPEWLQIEITPLVAVLHDLTERIAEADARLAHRSRHDTLVRRLCTVPGVGPVTAVAFVATLDDVARFRGGPQVASYLGLVPRERSSGEKQRRGSITKAGNPRMRSLLIEAAWTMLRSPRPTVRALQTWAGGIARRRGRQVGAVALARRLAGILYAMWRDQTAYDPALIRGAAPQAAA